MKKTKRPNRRRGKKAALLIGGVSILGGLFLSYGGISNHRIAVLNAQCPQKGDVGWNYIRNNCDFKRTISDYCICATTNENDLIQEIDPTIIPDAKLRKFVVCDHTPGNGIQPSAKWYPIAATPPPTWVCETIIQKAIFRKSARNIKSRLYNKLKQKCCAECIECFIYPDEWGQCPYCLLDDSCSNHCLE